MTTTNDTYPAPATQAVAPKSAMPVHRHFPEIEAAMARLTAENAIKYGRTQPDASEPPASTPTRAPRPTATEQLTAATTEANHQTQPTGASTSSASASALAPVGAAIARPATCHPDRPAWPVSETQLCHECEDRRFRAEMFTIGARAAGFNVTAEAAAAVAA